MVFLFTLGSTTPFRMWCADYLPLMNAFGFSHCMRVFLLFACFVFVAPSLDTLFNDVTGICIKKIKKVALYLAVALVVCTVIIFPHAIFTVNYSKYFFIADFLWQITLLCIVYFIPIRFLRMPLLVLLFVLIDMSVSVYLTLPLTAFGKTKPSNLNNVINEFYNNNIDNSLLFSAQANKAIAEKQFGNVNITKKIPNVNFPSNTKFAAYVAYVSDKNNYNRLLSLPFAFATDSQIAQIKKINLGYNYANIDLLAKGDGNLVLQQNYYKRWKSDNPKNVISAYDSTLLQVTFQKGENHIKLYYYAKDIVAELIISICFILCGSIYIIYSRKIKKY